MELEHPHATYNINGLRRDTASRLPRGSVMQADLVHASHADQHQHQNHQDRDLNDTGSSANNTSNRTTTHNTARNSVAHHNRTYSTSTIAIPRKLSRPLTHPLPLPNVNRESISSAPPQPREQPTSTNPKNSRIPASHSRNGLLEEFWSGPPPAMITQGSYKIDTTSTTDWVASQQQQSLVSPTSGDGLPPPSPAEPLSARSANDSSGSRPLIKPIRAFKPSSRKSAEMASRRVSTAQDGTVMSLDRYTHSKRPSNQTEQDEHNSDDSDLFLRAAREEELARQASHVAGDSLSRTDSRTVRHAISLPNRPTSIPSSLKSLIPILNFSSTGSDQETSNASRTMEEHGSVGQALTYRPSERERAPTALDDLNRSRFYGVNPRSTPTTPTSRTFGSREISPEAASHGRRGSQPDPASVLPPRASYRQSNLSYSAPRTYNSSPLVSRSTDMHEVPETPRAVEGTESTVSTTAPSTVWDELEDLKSRIHRLELTGKIPATSGAAISRASNDRPPTATTTVTTMSSSPKRGRGHSFSPSEATGGEIQPHEVHPLLHAALAKSKPLLPSEVYKALEATTSDALAIASMVGSSGQPGPNSSSQSTVGGSGHSDRQVRRKADGLCRSLTELCLALSDGKTDNVPPATILAASRPSNRELEVLDSVEEDNLQRHALSTDLLRVKSSPRALSRLEQRRSSLLATSSLPSPRYAPSDAGTPTQSSMGGRRTSLLLRNRRGGTEEPEDEDETRLRAPSRATTEVGRMRGSPREYVSQEPLPERPLSIHSALPVRRHYASSSLPNAVAPAPIPPPTNLGGRRYLDRTDRSTSERDNQSVVGRLKEERVQRKSSIGQGFGLGRTDSLTRRTRQPSGMESSAGQNGGYQ
ncbi:hypothetical protein LARI1_G006298 [Lachnellula arida]|uniref:Uncharacterized protein n=1 Tax=Lachnellula arida TaxID=1316785 RepID=A0A8T9B7E3_9HELO|nr:hypothetical protein LARI1_G006298 [Lachnellula arida]